MADRSRSSSDLARFFFALDDPISYLTAERIERALGPIEWIPVLGPLSESAGPASSAEREQRARDRMRLAEREADVQQVPLVEPHRFPMDSRTAARAAAFAAEEGAGAAFGLALMRLAFCGGFDIGSFPVIEEAAAVAGLSPAEAVAAARDRRLDLQLDATSRGLRARGIISPPAISIGESWFDGRDAVIAAVSFSAARRLGTPRIPVS
jgi:2-hydroxychromene-2-carboxylate isomerase